MASYPVVPSAQVNAPVLWLVTDETSVPYEHKLYGECDCKSCSPKKSHLVLPQ